MCNASMTEIRLDDLAHYKLNISGLIEFLQTLLLLTKFPLCCGQIMKLALRSSVIDGHAFRCLVCRTFSSIRKGTFHEKSKLSLYQIVMLLAYYCEGIHSQNFLIKQSELSHHETLVDWKSFVRDIFMNHVLNHSAQIGFPGIGVQVDESPLCKRKYGVGRILSNQDLWIVGSINETGAVLMELTQTRMKDPEVEEALHQWCSILTGKGVNINGPILKVKSEELDKKRRRNDFKATDS
ncbi:hypothetical protein RF11_13898 [Thelohanellus kitauei]|uniref:ISXO2-like transposase domain-containing protein n=1 Tax=Thelohanellus kitauei TaxID=669202 RepID=A0A0C2M1H2_THEKT|nr:hypothetical protein RF11_13898 [Thelohanellus kitauei]